MSQDYAETATENSSRMLIGGSTSNVAEKNKNLNK
jgi:hypothetical protein